MHTRWTPDDHDGHGQLSLPHRSTPRAHRQRQGRQSGQPWRQKTRGWWRGGEGDMRPPASLSGYQTAGARATLHASGQNLGYVKPRPRFPPLPKKGSEAKKQTQEIKPKPRVLACGRQSGLGRGTTAIGRVRNGATGERRDGCGPPNSRRMVDGPGSGASVRSARFASARGVISD
ncbi:hypothetical protein BS50DRAFT_270398 [Corynespora cassiicola Philippines]|uniref:Uncharacterized protein n=1 Tax=Corynespora cassiicola Philippines TaxID=1448308 RepID=A0A2T2P0T4_CORCC|nr:hypothetical protein BS50DRAFT_270398 [Corynespora cassiicola Philippines]